ncbi:MAG: ParB/RepB/Spo0J family partition protein [Acidobacteriia bacterium]|nr:ParB/RepB/Spo0J family partition protein [Terriglobia bacterium]
MTEIQDIELRLIDEPETALRAEIDDVALDELASDIRDNGLYYPVIVRQVADRFEVVDGHRRLLAHRRLGLVTMRCIVHGADDPPPESVKLKCNLLREDNTDAEIAVWLGELAQKHGKSLDELCAMVRRSEGWVNDRIDLLRGDPDVLNALGMRQINFSQAKVLNRCKEKSWRDLGLHYAIADHIPAHKLHEWLVRNTVAPNVVANPNPVEPANGNGAGEHIAGIVCDWCGGYKDPQNMVQLWLHRWEWELVQQMLKAAHEAKEA